MQAHSTTPLPCLCHAPLLHTQQRVRHLYLTLVTEYNINPLYLPENMDNARQKQNIYTHVLILTKYKSVYIAKVTKSVSLANLEFIHEYFRRYAGPFAGTQCAHKRKRVHCPQTKASAQEYTNISTDRPVDRKTSMTIF